MANPSGPSPKRHKIQSANGRHFGIETLLHLLYGKKNNEPVDLTKLKKNYYDPSTSAKANQEDEGFSYAIKSFPPEVQLCTSSIPGARYGVCAKRAIPEGTWIGPYEGKRVKPEDLTQNLDNSYIWEVYENGNASCYIDGSDESSSSWMRYIRCARTKTEQNLYAFQYLGNVFYRSFKEISPGTEMLVWYDDKYPQYMGIPVGLQEIEFVNANDIEQTRRLSSRDRTNDDKLFQKNQDLSIHRPRGQSIPPSLRLPPSSHASHIREPIRTVQHVPTTSQDNYIYPGVRSEDQPLVPASAYGEIQSRVSVNISAGIPSLTSTGRVSGRAHPGITGIHNPVVQVHDPVVQVHDPVVQVHHPAIQVQTLEEGTINFRRGQIPSPPDIENVTTSSMSVNTEWISSESDILYQKAPSNVYSRPSNQPSDLSNQPGAARKLPSSDTVVSVIPTLRPSNQPSDLSNQPGAARKLPSSDTVVSVNNEAKTSSEETRRGWRLSYLPYKEVTEDDLKERGYPVKGNSPQRPRSTRRRQSPPRMGVYVWKDDDDIFNEIQESAKIFEEVKATESDSNSSKETNGEEIVGSNIDEISMWRCRQCQKTFTQRVQLQIHVCPNEPFKPYRCGQCEMSFDTATQLRSHVDTHASEKPFKCGFCSRSFAGATTLNNHIRTHMGKRPFTCECGKSFAQAGQLARHQRTPGECELSREKNIS